MNRLDSVLALVLMVLFGFGVYYALDFSRTKHHETPVVQVKQAAFTLPGTIYMVQNGAIIKLSAGQISQVAGAPSNAAWTEPTLTPNGSQLLTVRRTLNYSDLYLLGLDGSVQKQLTHNQAQSFQAVEENYWALYPRYSADGSSIFFATDHGKDFSYRTDLAIWDMPADGGTARQWTDPNWWTGGDVQPTPLPNGQLLYTKYDIDGTGDHVSTLQVEPGPFRSELDLTPAADKCGQPAINPDGTRLVMVCPTSPRTQKIQVWQFDGQKLVGDPLVIYETGLAGAPSWSPDGTGLLFLAPGVEDPTGGFQLWYAPLYGPTKQLTSGLNLEGTSPAVWKLT